MSQYASARLSATDRRYNKAVSTGGVVMSTVMCVCLSSLVSERVSSESRTTYRAAPQSPVPGRQRSLRAEWECRTWPAVGKRAAVSV